jgi:hypothetical protein
VLFCYKKYKYRATFCRAKAKEKSQWKILITNCRNEVAVILKSGNKTSRRKPNSSRKKEIFKMKVEGQED